MYCIDGTSPPSRRTDTPARGHNRRRGPDGTPTPHGGGWMGLAPLQRRRSGRGGSPPPWGGGGTAGPRRPRRPGPTTGRMRRLGVRQAPRGRRGRPDAAAHPRRKVDGPGPPAATKERKGRFPSAVGWRRDGRAPSPPQTRPNHRKDAPARRTTGAARATGTAGRGGAPPAEGGWAWPPCSDEGAEGVVPLRRGCAAAGGRSRRPTTDRPHHRPPHRPPHRPTEGCAGSAYQPRRTGVLMRRLGGPRTVRGPAGGRPRRPSR